MSLQLDARQRAMLEEMHVRVWWPEEAPAVAVAALAQPVPTVAPLAQLAAPVAPVPPAAAVAPMRALPVPAAPVPAPAPPGARDGRAGAIAAMDWSALQHAVPGCQACKLCGTRKNTVFGVGPAMPDTTVPPRADWLVVGEAPGEHEDLRGEPFVGQAGKLLDNMLRAVGVGRRGDPGEPRSSAFITNVLKCRPPGNRNPEPDEVAQCEPFLRRQIELLRPRIILAVGRFAVQSLLAGTVPDVQTTPLGRLRGKVYRYQGVPVVVSYHPAYLLRSLPDKAKAWADLCLAMSVVESEEA